MSESKDLVAAAELPSDEAIMRRYEMAIAKSPMDIKRGEAVLIDRHGVAFGRSRFGRYVLAMRALIFGSVIAGGVLAVAGAWLPSALLYSIGVSPILWAKYRGHSKLIAIDVLLRQGHLYEAQRRFDAVPQLRRRSPAEYGWIAGNIASHRGDYATAIEWWRETLPRSEGVFREAVKASIVKALLLSGKIVEAQRDYDDVRFPSTADDVLTGLMLTKLMMTLHDALPALSTEDLHDCASRLLAYSHTDVELAALGWAFERAGDDDMAQMLANEALDRMHYPYLATWWPALQQWLARRTAQEAGKENGSDTAT